MKSLIYLILAIKFLLLAFMPVGMLLMPSMGAMQSTDTKSMDCMNDYCQQSTSSKSTVCLDHCISTLKTDTALPIYQILPALWMLVAIAIIVNFFETLVSFFQSFWQRNSIGKLIQINFLRTVVLLD